jgi:hypothetical protein
MQHVGKFVASDDAIVHAATLSPFSAPRITILSASFGNGFCSAIAWSHGAHPDIAFFGRVRIAGMG